MAGKGRIIDRDLGYRKTIGAIRAMPATSVDVGIFRGKSNIVTGQSIIGYAAVWEFLRGKSFLRSTVDQFSKVYRQMIRKAGDDIIAGKASPVGGMTKLGTRIMNDVKKKITILGLIDTGAMRNAVSWRVFVSGSKAAEGKTEPPVSG